VEGVKQTTEQRHHDDSSRILIRQNQDQITLILYIFHILKIEVMAWENYKRNIAKLIL